MATCSELVAYVREQSLIEADDLSTESVRSIINRGYLELAGAYRWPWTITTNASVATTNGAFTLPADFAFLDTVRLDDDYLEVVSRKRVEQDDLEFNSSGDTPRYFFIEGNTGQLLPAPTGAGTVSVTYHAVPAELELADTPDFTALHHYVLADFALWKLLQREEMYERANVHRMEWLQGVETLRRFYDRSLRNTQRMTLGQRQGVVWGNNYPFEVG